MIAPHPTAVRRRPTYLTPSRAYSDAESCASNDGGIVTWCDQLHLSSTRTSSLSSYFTATIHRFSRG